MTWYTDNSGGQAHAVGTKCPNAWGLYDMHGNVWEWCEDQWHDNYQGAPADVSPWLASGDSYRVFRGGGWNDIADDCRSADRDGFEPGDRGVILGFRLALFPAVSA